MITRIKRLLLSTAAVMGLLIPVMVPAVARAQTTGDIGKNFCQGADITLGTGTGAAATCDTADAETKVNTTVKNALNLFSAVVGILSVVMIIIGGVKYITSGGESGKVTSAKDSILFAVVGLIVVALAQLIVRFVLQRFGNPT
jgi:cytochrome bd-type quinol oxidase subunit 2